MPLRVDSWPFVAIALALVAVMRVASGARARAAYALVSAGVYASIAPDLRALAISAGFVLWPWLLLRSVQRGPAWLVQLLITTQVAIFVWARRYLCLLPGVGELTLIAHAAVVLGASYIVLRQVELVLYLDAEPTTVVSLTDYTAFTIGVFTLLAGPIVPFAQFQRGFVVAPERETRASLSAAANRIINGYIKLALIGPLLQRLTSLETLRSMELGLGARLAFFYLFPLYIYFNFSGYCDIVIGFGRLARCELPENFDHPYLATNIQRYWQRWHITFSQWIRAHLFFPSVRALRSSRWALLRALSMPLSVLFSFLLVGLWHGPDPGFAVFGLLHGLAVLAVAPYGRLLDRLLSERARRWYETHPVAHGLRMAVCYHYLCLTMLFFERPLSQLLPLLF